MKWGLILIEIVLMGNIYIKREGEREKVVSSRLGEIDFEESVMGGRLKFNSRDYIHYFLMRMITC